MVVRAASITLVLFLQTAGAAWAQLSDPVLPGSESGVRSALDAPKAGALSSLFWFEEGRPVWWRDGAWSSEAAAALRAIGAADRHGLRAQDYSLPRLAAMLQNAAAGDAGAVAVADTALSTTVLRFVSDLYNGRIDPRTVGWKAETASRPVETMLVDALREGRLEALLAGPNDPGYRGLQQARTRYETLAALSWPMLPEGPTLGLGDEGPRVVIAREQLTILGDLAEPAAPTAGVRTQERRPRADDAANRGVILASAVAASDSRTRASGAEAQRRTAAAARFDAELAAAVRRFQERHGLEPDGRIGSGTRLALNVSPAERLRQIDVNLERRRWLPDDLGQRHLLVNVPAFELTAFDRASPVLRMRVVVGEPDWQTPVISDEIVNLRFAPTWTIPPKIVREETLAQIRRDPGYLERKSIRVFRYGREISPWELDPASVAPGSGYVFRQDSGPQNALGQLRFSLTNPYDIYLHDTPTVKAFAQANRALSHGCVRVQEPEQLALFVLNDPAWDRARVETAMNAAKTHHYSLPMPVPVHILYLTAWVDDLGRLQFRSDIYGHDARTAAALQRRPAWEPPVS